MERIWTEDELIVRALDLYMSFLQETMKRSDELIDEGLETYGQNIDGGLAATYIEVKALKKKYDDRISNVV